MEWGGQAGKGVGGEQVWVRGNEVHLCLSVKAYGMYKYMKC